MTSDNPAFNALMGGLRQKYLVQLKIRSQAIGNFRSRCEQKDLSEELCDAARKQAHNLAGSGATYGFGDISTAARALEHSLQDGERDAGVLGVLASALLAACAQTPTAPLGYPAAPPASGETARHDRPILLIADDDPAIRDLLTGLFSEDAEIIVAVNGRDALKMIESRHPDLVILDDAMPEMSGMKVLEALRAEPTLTNIPVVMLTASNREAAVMRGLMGGAVDYIVKPFIPDELGRTIRTRLKRQGYTVLIADDSAVIRALLRHKFRAAGWHVLLAEDGEEALQEAHRHKPDLVILDRMMPGLDGIAVLQKLRQEDATKTIPVLFLTAKSQEQDILEGFRLGAADYISKPFKPEEVLARCVRLLER